MKTSILLIPILALVSCGDSTGNADDTTETGLNVEHHPNVPDEFKWLWNTDYCEKRTRQGQTYKGDQVYMRLVESESTPESFTGVEEVYWFWKKSGWEGDCIDKLRVTGVPLTGDFGLYGCSECDEGWKLTRTLEEDNCGVEYRYVLDETEALSEEYWGWVMFDTITPSGTPNEDDLMRVSHSYIGKDGMAWDHNWCLGYCHVYWDTEVYGPPARYDWVHSLCFG